MHLPWFIVIINIFCHLSLFELFIINVSHKKVYGINNVKQMHRDKQENYLTLLYIVYIWGQHPKPLPRKIIVGPWTKSLILAVLHKNLCKTDFHLFLLWIRQGKWPTETNNKNLTAQISQPQSDLNSFFIVHSQHEFAVVTLIVEKWAKSTRGGGWVWRPLKNLATLPVAPSTLVVEVATD